MIGQLKLPKPNRIILVWNWNKQEGSKDYDEINSNQFNPACYDGWKEIKAVRHNGRHSIKPDIKLEFKDNKINYIVG